MKKWEFPSCDYCNKNITEVIWDDVLTWEHTEIFRIVKCLNCGLIFLSPRPKQKFIGKYYSNENYWGEDIKNIKKSKTNLNYFRNKNFAKIYRQIFKYKNKGSILDIGCGTGIFLTKFRDLGWNVYGLDLSKETSDFALKNYNVRVFTGDLLKLSFDKKKFDAITLNSSLEHLFKPKESLSKVSSLLDKNGILVITVPNFNSFGRMIFGRNWLGLHPPKHLYHFTTISLKKMLAQTGFQVKKTDYWYFSHNYYSLFESFRYKFSPKFNNSKISTEKHNQRFDSFKVLGKMTAAIFAVSISFVGSLIGKGETITIYANKA